MAAERELPATSGGPSGKVILSVSTDLSFRRWDVETGNETAKHEFVAFPASPVIAPDGRTALVVLESDLRQWDIDNWQEIRRLSGQRPNADQLLRINSIAIDTTGQRALAAGDDSTLRIWNLSGQTISRRFATDGSTPVNAVALRSDGTQMLTGMGSGEAVLWDVESGSVVRRLAGGDGFPVTPGCAAFSPAEVGETSALVCYVDYQSGGTSLILWDLATGEELRHLEEGHVTYVRAVAFTPDGRSALAGSQIVNSPTIPDWSVGDLILWDLETGTEIFRVDLDHDVVDVEVNGSGDLALTGSARDSDATLWDMATGREIRQFEGHTLSVLNVAFGPEERTVLTSSADGTIIRWDIESGEIIRRYVGHSDLVLGLDVSPDGKTLASSSADGVIILWDLETGRERLRISAHVGVVWDIAFHPDGESLFSIGGDGKIIEWEIADPSLDELLDWIHANRYVRPLTCEEEDQYNPDAGDCENVESA